ncbi:MAG: septal ring-binding cell division protein DamX [Urechidicola sp.]|jgi:septal ring-binding cell division protein DamX
MSQIQSKDTPYFLTKQTANLQEDFGREIKNGASLFLLYGEEGVGKTRLLKALLSTRLNELRTHWIDCKESVDEANAPTELGSVLERTLDAAAIGDVIVADHFELATNKIKHQLLLSWSTDGLDKKFSLIIATGPSGLKEVRNLATQYRVHVKSFQLLPLTRVEIDDYCACTLFPSLPRGPLSMPKQSRLALNETRGVFSKVRDVVEQQGDHISTQWPPSSPSMLKPTLVVFGLTIMLLLVGLVYYFMPVASVEPLSLNQQEKKRERVELALPAHNLTNREPAVVEVDKPKIPLALESTKMIQVPAIAEPAEAELALVETTGSSLINQQALSKTELAEASKAEVSKAEVSKAEASKAEASKAEASKAEASKAEASKAEASKAEASKAEASKAEVEAVKYEYLIDIVGEEPYSDWFKAELTRSRDWFEASEKSHATIHLISISLGSETDDAYLNYVEKLQKKGVDISQLRVYVSRVKEDAIFGIVFGDYDSREAARKSIANLPSEFRANQPFPRSLGGIWDEISQL